MVTCSLSVLVGCYFHDTQPLVLDTSSVTMMSHMFYSANRFNQPLTFDTSIVKVMDNMQRPEIERGIAPPRLLRFIPRSRRVLPGFSGLAASTSLSPLT